MNTDFIDKYIEENYSEKRKKHTIGVRDTAEHLAEKYGGDKEKARVCALYHDMFRRASDELIDEYISRHGLDEKYRGDPDLAHGKIASVFMEEEMGIEDRDMLDAVAYHTTGRKGMSKLEKIIYLADAIEPNRDYPSVGHIRETAEKDLDKACLEVFDRSADYLKAKGREMDPDSIEALDELRKEVEKKELDNKETAMKLAEALDKKRASDVTVIDIGGKSIIADYLIIAGAGSERQAEALADEAEDVMESLGQEEKSIEGRENTGWILLDFGDILVNVFSGEMRDKYDLEKVWGDCESIRVATED